MAARRAPASKVASSYRSGRASSTVAVISLSQSTSVRPAARRSRRCRTADPLPDDRRAGPVGDGEPAPGSEDRGGEPDGRQVSLADLAQADRDPQLPGVQTGLVRVGHHRRVAQRGGLDRVLVAEVGADQEPGGGGEVAGPGDAVPDEVVVVVERAVQVAVPAAEAVEGVPQQPAGLLVVEVRDAGDERPRAAAYQGGVLTRDEELDDDPAWIRGEGHAVPDGQGPGHDHRRACWRVEISARVDSAPWLRLGPCAVSPS